MRLFFLGCYGVLVLAVSCGLAFSGPFFRSRSVCGPNGCSVVSFPATSVSPAQPASPTEKSTSISPAKKPNPIPAAAAGERGDLEEQLGGVDRSTGVGSVDSLSLGGIPLERDAIIPRELNLPEDAARPYVVIVGSPEYRKRQLEELAAVDAAAVAQVVDYDPGQWQAAGVGYSPGVWFVGARGADGKASVSAVEDSLEGKRPELAKWVEAIRKPDGILDRKILPSLKRAVDPTPIIWERVKPFVAGGLAAAAWLVGAFALSGRKVA